MGIGKIPMDKVNQVLDGMVDELQRRPAKKLADMDPATSVLVMMDMINGFAKEGALASPRVKALIPEIARIQSVCKEMGMKIIAFCDAHPEDSPEFDVYPRHSIKGTVESEIVEELAAIGGYERMNKKSTNGFHEPGFHQWYKDNADITTWIIVGNCTDICVYQFATTMQTFANTHERPMKVIVPINAVDTYDGELHSGDLHHIVFLHSMLGNGIDVVCCVE